MYSRSTGEVNSNRVTSSLLRKRTRLLTHAHEVRALTFEVTDNFGSNVVLPCGAYGPRSPKAWVSFCLFNSFLTVEGNFSVMTGTLLYVFGSWERHSELNRKRYTSRRDRYQLEIRFVVDISENWTTDRNWHTKLLDPWKVNQLNIWATCGQSCWYVYVWAEYGQSC